MARRILQFAVLIVAFSAALPGFAQNPVSVSKTAVGGPVAGSNFAYTVTVRQPDLVTAAANVVLTDGVPTNTTFVSAVENSGPGFACTTPAVGATVGTISCSISTLPAGSADAVFTFTFHIPATLQPPTLIRNTADVSTTTTDGFPADNTATVQLGVITSADLGVVKTGPSNYTLGTNYTYTITVSNAGPSDSQSVHMTDNLFGPAETFLSITQTSGVPFTCTTPAVGSTGLIDCSTATLPTGSSAVFQLVVKSDPRFILPVNSAQISSASTPDPNHGNDMSTFVPTTTTSDADLQVTKSGPLTAIAGQTVTYTITAINNGPSYASGVPTLTDTLPPGSLTLESWTQTSGGVAWGCITPGVGNSGTITCSPPDGNPGTTATFRLVARIPSTFANGGSVTNTATYTSSTPDSVSSNNSSSVTTNVTRLADLSVSKVANAGTVNPGANITYTVVLSNSGPSDAATVAVDDVVPTGTAFVNATQTSGPPFSCSLASGTIHCTALSLASGATAQFSFVVQNNTSNLGGTTISNTATASTTTSESTLANNSSTATVTVTAAGLAITKSASPNPVQAGTNITYTVTVSNVGTIGAHNATMTDAVPANTTFVSNIQTAGPSFACTNPAVGGTGTISCTDALLAAGASATFSIVVRVNPTTANSTTIANTANTSTSDTDPNLSNNTASASTTVAVTADVVVTKSAPATVGTNQPITYSITVSNNGSSDAEGVTLTDTLPAGTTFASETQTSGPAFNCTTPPSGGTGTITCTIATLGAGATSTFSVVVNVTAGIGTTITNTASATSTSADANPANNSSSASTTVAGPDLAVTKSDSPDPVTAGSNITYTVVVMNNGTAGANNVSLSDAVPANTTFVSNTQTAGTPFSCSNPAVGAGGTINCSAALLGPAGSATFQIVVQVGAATPPSTVITNTATASTTDFESNTSNNSATATTTVAAIATADLTVTKSDAPDPVVAGGQITYTINVTNIGSASASNVSLTDALPANTTFVSVTASQGSCSGTATVTCNLGTIASSASATVTLVVAVGASVPAGTTISNTATAATTSTESSTANNSATTTTTVAAIAIADLTITKSDAPDPVNAGSNVTYTITVTNSGSAAAANVQLSDVLPANTTFVSFSAPGGWTPSTPAPGSSGTVTATNPSLAASATASFTLVVAVSSAATGSIANTATVTTTSTESSTANNSATAVTTVNAAPSTTDVSLTKTANAPSVAASSPITYTIRATNTGSVAASNVSVSDVLPSGTTFVSMTPSQGTCSGTGTLVCSLGTIGAGASATITLIVTAPSTTTVVNNTATLTSSNDSNVANNSASVAVNVVANVPALSPLLLLLLAIAIAAIASRLLTE